MLQLHAKCESSWPGDPVVLRLSTDRSRTIRFPGHEALLILPDEKPEEPVPDGYSACLLPAEQARHRPAADGWIPIPRAMDYLRDGDIVRLNPSRGEITVLYRRSSRFNSIFATERCNSQCIMCSQPPKDADDRHLVDIYLDAIPMMDTATTELGITGGEPTLLGDRLPALLQACKAHLPNTAIHMLSNGRLFNYLRFCQDVERVGLADLVIGIPIYSDIASQHDYVVQSGGAFDQTIRGIMNLERCGLRIELRVVLQRDTIPRLPQLARFIARNLPFVEHVALMGLELMGYARPNLEAVWIDPYDYQSELTLAVRQLTNHRMNVSIYNHPLCVLPAELWAFARQSISDWKNEFIDQCGSCAVRDQCGGFFSSAGLRRSKHIQPLTGRTLVQLFESN